MLELDEFGQLVADLRRYKAEARVVVPSQALLPHMLPAGQRYELRVRRADAALEENLRVHVEQHDLKLAPCVFETIGGDGREVAATLVLAPLSAPVTLRAELGRLARRSWA